MWFFRSKKTEQRLEEIDRNLAESFTHVRADIDGVSQWVRYLHERLQQTEQQLSSTTKTVAELPESIRNMRVSVEQDPVFAQAQSRLVVVENRLSRVEKDVQQVSVLSAVVQPLPQQVQELAEHVRALAAHHETAHRVVSPLVEKATHSTPVPQVTRLREKLLQKLSRHSKEYVKGLVLSMIHKYGKISGQQLRDIIVDEQGLCSRSSFYRLLEELEADDTVNVVSDGRSNLYLDRGVVKNRA